jgi:hypothetical protein
MPFAGYVTGGALILVVVATPVIVNVPLALPW